MTDSPDTRSLDDPPAEAPPTWTMRETWRVAGNTLRYQRERIHCHMEPRMGEVMDVALEANEDLINARARNEYINLITTGGVAVVVNPSEVVAIEVELIGPDGKRVTDVQPGRLDVQGGVIRDDVFDGDQL